MFTYTLRVSFEFCLQDKLLTKLDEHEPEIAVNQDEEVIFPLVSLLYLKLFMMA